MTKCNWKIGLILFLGAFFAAQPCLAADEHITYDGSNTTIAKDIEAFNRKAKRVENKNKLINEGIEANRKCFSQKFIVKRKIKFFHKALVGLAVTIDSSVLSTIGNLLDAGWEILESKWSSTDSDLKNMKAQIEYYYRDALTNAESEDDKKDATEKYQVAIKTYNEMYSAWTETKAVCDKAASYGEISGSDEVFEYTYCPTDDKGNVIKDAKCKTTYFIRDGSSLKTVVGATRGCIPLPAKLAEAKSCIFCPMFKKLFNAAQAMTTNSFSATANALSIMLVIGFGIWLAFKVMVLVSSFTKQDGPKFISEILTQAFKVLLAFVLLKNASFVYNQIMGPLLKAGMEFGMAMLFEKGSSYLNGCDSVESLKGVSGGLLPTYLYSQLECFIQAIQAEISIPQAIGSSLMCVSRNAAASDIAIVSITVAANFIPDFGMLLEGLIIWVFAWLISLAFAFYLLDAIVRLGIVGALMPFLIASWPLKMTSGYTKKGWTIFMNTLFTFVFLGLVISVNVQLILYSTTGGEGGRKAIESALNSDLVTELKQILDIGFAGFLILIACCIFGFKLTMQASSLAGEMAGGGGGEGIGNKLGGLAASATKGAALGSAKMVWGTTKVAGNVLGVTPKLRKGADKVKAYAGRKLGSLFGVGGSSGAAGGRKARAAAGGAAGGGANRPTQQQGNGFTINGNQQQAQRVQDAQPRNGQGGAPQATGGNGSYENLMNNMKHDNYKMEYGKTAEGKAANDMNFAQSQKLTDAQLKEHTLKQGISSHEIGAAHYSKMAEQAANPKQKAAYQAQAQMHQAQAADLKQQMPKAQQDIAKEKAALDKMKADYEAKANKYADDKMANESGGNK